MNIGETIPMIVDDVKTQNNFEMTRLNYFSIETVDYLEELTIKHGDLELPATVINLQGVITSTIKKTPFLSWEEIDALFDSIDDTEALFVDTNDVWLPNILFSKKLKRGDLIRISPELFRLAIAYRSDSISYDDFISSSVDLSSDIMTSPEEEAAFREWSQHQIGFSKDTYHAKDDTYKLKYTD